MTCTAGWGLLSTKAAGGAQLMGERVLVGSAVALALGITAALGWSVISASTDRQAQRAPTVLGELSTADPASLLARLFANYGYDVWLEGEPHEDRADLYLRRYDQRAVVVLRRCAHGTRRSPCSRS